MKHTIFVYGTLKRGYPNAHIGMPQATYRGEHITIDRYPLVIGGPWFTPYLINEPGNGCQVTGEVYEIGDTALRDVDELESVHLPNGYRRIKIAVRPIQAGGTAITNGSATHDGTNMMAWTYLRERNTINGIHDGPHDGPMSTYPLDPRYVPGPNR